MRYSIIVVAAALSALALSACDKPTTVVAPATPPAAVPGPAGPQGTQGTQGEQGTQGAPAEKGATGEQGEQGKQGKTGGDTIVVVPAPAPQQR